MSEKRRQYLANLALRSPNANERETARQQFLALDGPGKPLLPDLGPAERGELARLRYALEHTRGQEAFLRQQLGDALARESNLRQILVEDRKSAQTDEPTKKPALRAITFATWAVLSASVWGWGPLATLFSACLVMAVAASLFER